MMEKRSFQLSTIQGQDREGNLRGTIQGKDEKGNFRRKLKKDKEGTMQGEILEGKKEIFSFTLLVPWGVFNFCLAQLFCNDGKTKFSAVNRQKLFLRVFNSINSKGKPERPSVFFDLKAK